MAPVKTIIQGGNFQKTSILNNIAAKAKSIGAKIELVQIGCFGVKGVQNIRARDCGNNTVEDAVILDNSTLELKDAHDISTKQMFL